MSDIPDGFRIVRVPGYDGAFLLNERAFQEITLRVPRTIDPYSGSISAQQMREYAFGSAFFPNAMAIMKPTPDPLMFNVQTVDSETDNP